MEKRRSLSGLDSDDKRGADRREALWRHLETLVRKASGSGLRSLTDSEMEDLGRTYRAAATHLSLLQVFGASARRRRRLNALVSRAHHVIYGRPQRGSNLKLFLWSFLMFPETVRRTIFYHAAAALLLLGGGAYGFVGASLDPEWALEFVPPFDERTPFADRDELHATLLQGRPVPEDFSGDPETIREIESGEKALFAAFLWRHNTLVALTAFFSGFLFGLPTVYLLVLNGAFLGVYTYTFHHHDLAYEWWAWILPHGVTEILAIVLLSGGGLYIGRMVLAPGTLTRLGALRNARAHILRLLLFAFPMLFLAALIESFVRQSGLPDGGRYVFAIVSAVLWALYLATGRSAARAETGEKRRRTVADRAVPLPSHEELFGAAGGRW